ncbi:60S ribosomal protein L35 [Cyanidioschyzon merolae strain 10D]|uniref:60S ribosomal protein L35 n=1 Tax=Cyanidioschyzon merolae (strain NIES-3377 / 10D) TaxID=280699 RepID=M1V3X3_CYAM1|nr:60S ribosomal protein L35 [Cyanidioschyzon merolae strain 10D]BAM78995.1 60S ribosomal protein L35 [Cyanidioschyzon merolae strain 10D]|eukprot:XP_005535281.1 60S ribosomal protein L35 [Cyanidioschyzon merolae strain 10D]
MVLKAHELRGKSRQELEQQLQALKTELQQLRVLQVSGGGAGKLGKIKEVRKSIARVLTVMSQARRKALREEYMNKKFKPLDLRPKLTRAMRRKLSKTDAARKTLRQQKREQNFPKRRFAILPVPRDSLMQSE